MILPGQGNSGVWRFKNTVKKGATGVPTCKHVRRRIRNEHLQKCLWNVNRLPPKIFHNIPMSRRHDARLCISSWQAELHKWEDGRYSQNGIWKALLQGPLSGRVLIIMVGLPACGEKCSQDFLEVHASTSEGWIRPLLFVFYAFWNPELQQKTKECLGYPWQPKELENLNTWANLDSAPKASNQIWLETWWDYNQKAQLKNARSWYLDPTHRKVFPMGKDALPALPLKAVCTWNRSAYGLYHVHVYIYIYVYTYMCSLVAVQ